LTLDRQERLNALSTDLMHELVVAFDELHSDSETWAIVITGAGDRAFSAGIDVKELADRDDADEQPRPPMRGTTRNLFEVVLECGKPTIAALNGWAMGGGLELALACDLRIAATHAKLGLPEAKRGMGANFGAQLLSRMVPPGIAYEMLYLGEPIDAARAERWGLVNEIVAAGALRERVDTLARAIAANAPLTIRRYKAAISRGRDLPLAAALRLETGPDPYTSADRREGIKAFNERRPPRWLGR
jgi:enoyl-CoA hydratase